MVLTSLQRRVLQISYEKGLTHIGSCISVLPILEAIYGLRKPGDPVCLGAGHAGVALYACLEYFCGQDAEALLAKHGIHATRDEDAGIYVSSGSLGQVETVAMGMALADREREVWLVSSDGGFSEGSIWETLMHKRRARVTNLRWFVNANGWSACQAVDVDVLENAIAAWDLDVNVVRTGFAGIPFLQALDAHYYTMSDADWAWVEAQEVFP